MLAFRQLRKVIFVIFSICFVNYAMALSPKQYCEKLHAKRTLNTTSSYELLNIEYLSSNVFSLAGTDQMCDEGGCSNLPVTRTYMISTAVSKFCRDGEFLFKNETKTKHVTNCPQSNRNGGSSTNLCPPEAVICEGPGC